MLLLKDDAHPAVPAWIDHGRFFAADTTVAGTLRLSHVAVWRRISSDEGLDGPV